MAGPGKLSWDSVEVWQKLVAAIIASGVKIDVSSVATHFGTTYDTIENRLRPVKKQAKELKEAVSNGTQDKVVSTRKSPTKPKTPRKAATSFDAVSEGRITKHTPSKKTPKKDALKLEAMENSFSSSMMDGDDFVDSSSFHGGGLGALDFEDGMGNMFPPV